MHLRTAVGLACHVLRPSPSPGPPIPPPVHPSVHPCPSLPPPTSPQLRRAQSPTTFTEQSFRTQQPQAGPALHFIGPSPSSFQPWQQPGVRAGAWAGCPLLGRAVRRGGSLLSPTPPLSPLGWQQHLLTRWPGPGMVAGADTLSPAVLDVPGWGQLRVVFCPSASKGPCSAHSTVGQPAST